MQHRPRTTAHFLLLAIGVVILGSVAGVGARDALDTSFEATEPLTLSERRSTGRIINGAPVAEAGFQRRAPYLVALIDDTNAAAPQQSKAFCGGALVAPNRVLTAAHCVDGKTVAKLRVLTGTSDLANTNRATSQLIPVKSSVTHPSWAKQYNTGNDLAVLTLQANSKAPHVAVVGPGEDNIWGAGRGVIDDPARGPWFMGWGATTTVKAMSRFPNEITVPVWSDAACGHPRFGRPGGPTIVTNVLCTSVSDVTATPEREGRGACNGDSGSPLITLANGAPRLIAVFSFMSRGCVGAGADGMAKVATYRTWLQQQGVPIGTDNVTAVLPEPTELGAGAATPPGPPIDLQEPADQLVVAALGGSTQLRWGLREDVQPEWLAVRQGAAEVFGASAAGSAGYTLANARFRAGTYSWCVRGSDRYTKAVVPETCRTFVRSAAHAAQMTSARWRGTRGTFSGSVISSVARVSVTVKLKVGGRTISTKRLKVTTKPDAAVTRFTYTGKVPRGLRAKRVSAVMTVAGGGVTTTYRNTLR